MKVVILCGGQGMRLREETEYRPKPLVDVGGRPILWHIMKLYAHYGFRDFTLCLGYRGQMIKDYFLNYEAINNDFTICLGKRHEITYHQEHGEQDFRVTLAETGLGTMTGGRILRAARYLDGDTFMVAYGDGLSDVDISRVVEFHHKHGKLATVTVVRPISRYGILELGEDHHVSHFREKPTASGWANAGFFVFDRKVLDYIDNEQTMLEHEPLERLVQEEQLMAYSHEGFFFCIDTYREYVAINEMSQKGQTPWKVWE